MSAILEHVPEYTCDHGEPWGECCKKPRTFADSLIRRSRLRSLPKVEPLIENLVSLRSTVVMVGPTGAGKTIVAMSMAGSVATGNTWLGRKVAQVPVLYVVGEGAYGLDDRMSALEYAWGYDVADEQMLFAVKPGSLHLHQTWAQMTETAVQHGRRFVVLDTFSSLAPEADETKDAPRITRWLSDLSVAIDGTAMLIHHPGWGDSERSRGGYQLEANVDEVLLLRGNGGDPTISLERKKVKDGPAGERVWLRRRPILGSVIVEEITADVAVDTPMRDRVLAVIADMEQVTGPQLCKELAADQQRRPVYKVLHRLVSEGLVLADGPRGRHRYRLSKKADAR